MSSTVLVVYHLIEPEQEIPDNNNLMAIHGLADIYYVRYNGTGMSKLLLILAGYHLYAKARIRITQRESGHYFMKRRLGDGVGGSEENKYLAIGILFFCNTATTLILVSCNLPCP